MPVYEFRSGLGGVRARCVSRVRRPAPFFLGDDVTDTGVSLTLSRVEQQTKEMKRKLTETAAQVAVSQMAISIGTDIAFAAANTAAAAATAAGAAALAAGASASSAAIAAGSCVPIIGWAAAAVIAIGTFIGGRIGKRKAAEEVEKGKREIQDYGDKINAEVSDAEAAAGDQEFAAGKALADSGQPLSGLGSFLGISKRDVTQTLAKAQVLTVQKPIQAILRTGQLGARLVGDKRGAEMAKKWEDNWNRNSERVADLFARKLDNPYTMLAGDLDKIGRTVSGQEVVHVTRQQIAKLVAAAKKDMDEYRDKVMSTMAQPEYREAVRVNIAKGLRGDPQFASQVNEIAARSKMVDAEFSSSQQVAAAENQVAKATGTSTGGAGLLATAATLVSAFFLLRP